MALFSKRRETVDQVIDRLVTQHRTDMLEQELRKFDPSRLQDKEKQTWHFYWGVAAFRRGDRPEAFRRFTEAYSACPASDEIRFSLAQEYGVRGNPDKMIDLFRGCQFPKISSRHLLTASHYCYLWQRIDDAVHFLSSIFDAYFTLGTADDHFVYIRGLPFFGETWSYYLCYSILSGDLHEIEGFTRRAKAKLSDYDFDRLLLYLDCWKTQDFSPKIRELQTSLTTADPRFPHGYQQVQLASLKSLAEPDRSLLAGVSLGPKDFPWLADVLLVHHARIANIVRDDSEERRLINSFFQKQPMLFEPDHAANFGFVAYQETLKPRYQQTKET